MTDVHARVFPVVNSGYDIYMVTHTGTTIRLYDLNDVDLRILSAAIDHVNPQEHSQSEQFYEYQTANWLHSHTPPIANLESDGWELLGNPQPVTIDGAVVKWYVCLRRQLDKSDKTG